MSDQNKVCPKVKMSQYFGHECELRRNISLPFQPFFYFGVFSKKRPLYSIDAEFSTSNHLTNQ